MCDKKCRKFNEFLNKCKGIELIFTLKYISLNFEQAINIEINEVGFLLQTIHCQFNMKKIMCTSFFFIIYLDIKIINLIILFFYFLHSFRDIFDVHFV